jgi:hypothetical protein
MMMEGITTPVAVGDALAGAIDAAQELRVSAGCAADYRRANKLVGEGLALASASTGNMDLPEYSDWASRVFRYAARVYRAQA